MKSVGFLLLLVLLQITNLSSVPNDAEKQEGAKGSKVRHRRQNLVSTSKDDMEDLSHPDAFALSVEWANFVKRTDQISENLKKQLERFVYFFSDKNSEFSSNRTHFLADFQSSWIQIFKPIASIFEPLQEQLDLNKAYTVVDPAIGLDTLEKCLALAKSSPAKELDKGRLKWIEVNAMATTLHHIFNRLLIQFEQYGLGEIGEAYNIQYPSWTTGSSLNESGNTMVDMGPQQLVEFVHAEINSLGDSFHLIRILEKLLDKKLGLTGWDPSKTNLNRYCYGNNIYGLIHSKFDVLIDAAQHLVMADMKYSVVKMTYYVYKAYQAETGGGEKFTLQTAYDETMLNMTAHIDRKIKFGKLAEVPEDHVILPGPTVFRCDPLPGGCEGSGPKFTAPNCPPAVYMQQWVAYENGKLLTIPQDVNESVKSSDGTMISCLALERVAINSNGTRLRCKIMEKLCVDETGVEINDTYSIQVIPVLVDPNHIPYHRDALEATFPDRGQWGKLDCFTDPEYPPSAPHGPVGGRDMDATLPPGGRAADAAVATTAPPDSNCTLGPNDVGLGYIDCRTPGLTTANTAEFKMAFPGYLESELVLSPDGKCVGTCADYRNPTPTCTGKTTHCDLFRRSHCENKEDCMKVSQCQSKAKECIRASREVRFCPAPPGSGRVYDWYTIDGHPNRVPSLSETEGSTNSSNSIDITKCASGTIMKAKERWEIDYGVILNTPQYCELCLCICTDPIGIEGRHFFDIGPIVADADKGFVVTGLRFQQKDNIILLNIQQGKILPDGKVDPGSLSWNDLRSGHTPHLVPLGSSGFDKLYLDIVQPGKSTEVVTGVQWTVSNRALTLEVGFSTFDGKLGSANFRQANFPPPKEPRERYDLRDAGSPMNQRGPAQPYPISDNSKYVQFDASSLQKDGGQAVIPFFDLQSVSSPDRTPRPVRCVGILYKSKPGSGGFITIQAKF